MKKVKISILVITLVITLISSGEIWFSVGKVNLNAQGYNISEEASFNKIDTTVSQKSSVDSAGNALMRTYEAKAFNESANQVSQKEQNSKTKIANAAYKKVTDGKLKYIKNKKIYWTNK